MELPLTSVEPGEENGAVVDRPDLLVDLLKGDGLALERVADEDSLVLPSDHSGVVDLSGLVGAGILDRRQAFRKRPW